MANAIINAAGLILTAWDIGSALKGQKEPSKNQIQVSMIVGNAPNSGGSVPHVAVWDDNGNRIGQFGGSANGHIDGSSVYSINIDPSQNGDKPAQPAYLSLVMQENDAICLSAVMASGDGAQYNWAGDLAYTCGGQWYPSDFAIGGSNDPPRCIWLDHDHSNNIVAKGLGLHMRDFSADGGLVAQYRDNQDRLCKNTARMTFLVEPTVPDSILQFFNPPLKYHKGGDKDVKGVPKGGDVTGALYDPDLGIDRKTNGYPDFTDMKISNTRRHARDVSSHGRGHTHGHSKGNATQSVGPQKASSKSRKQSMSSGKPTSSHKSKNGTAKAANDIKFTGLKNLRPEHLTISDIPSHTATELCEHPHSLGPDFVSTVEKKMCDMTTGKTWPLCDEDNVSACFDLESKSMKGGAKRDVEDLPEKKYQTHDHWTGTRR